MKPPYYPKKKDRCWGVLYATIPQRSKTVIELLVFGNQDTHETSEILEVQEEMISRVLFKVNERFKLL